jgi:hypothetical protein
MSISSVRAAGRAAAIGITVTAIAASCSKHNEPEPQSANAAQNENAMPPEQQNMNQNPSEMGGQPGPGENQEPQGQQPGQENQPGTTGEEGSSQYRGGAASTMPGGTMPGGAPDVRTGLHAISMARCQREMKCGTVGPEDGKKFSSEDECVAKLDQEGSQDLTPDNCPNGMDPTKLQGCVASIKNEDCNNPLDTLDRMAACRSSTLCM